MPTTTGDIFLMCVQSPGLLSDLDAFRPDATTDTLRQILSGHMIHPPSDAVVNNLYADLQNIGMRIWLHELKTWVIAHPAPSPWPHELGTFGDTHWQPSN
jgi:hypothetical protein